MEGIDTIYFHGEDFPNEIFEIDVPQGKVNDVELTAIRDYLEELAGDHPLYQELRKNIMESTKLYLDDIRIGPKDYSTITNPQYFIELLEKCEITDISLDHDLGLGVMTGYDVAKTMVEKNIYPSRSINIHSSNPVGVQNMVQLFNRYAPKEVEITCNRIGHAEY